MQTRFVITVDTDDNWETNREDFQEQLQGKHFICGTKDYIIKEVSDVDFSEIKKHKTLMSKRIEHYIEYLDLQLEQKLLNKETHKKLYDNFEELFGVFKK